MMFYPNLVFKRRISAISGIKGVLRHLVFKKKHFDDHIMCRRCGGIMESG